MELTSIQFDDEIREMVDNICGAKDVASSALYYGANWLRYEFDEGGEFSFSLHPNSLRIDLDFYVFRSHDDCHRLDNIRCMLSGSDFESNCMGTTGLSLGSFDKFEYSGCGYFDDNYLAPITVDAGDILYLAIYNFTGPKSQYSIVHGGTASLYCPQSDEELSIDHQKNIAHQNLDRIEEKTKNPIEVLEIQIDVYPNPSAGTLRVIGTSISNSNLRIEIIDKLGNKLKFNDIKVNQIVDISHLTSGVYMVLLFDEDQLIFKQKIINIK